METTTTSDDHITCYDVTCHLNVSTATSNVSQNASLEPRWPFLGLAIVPVWILSGNLLVLLAVCRQRSLRTLSNWVIASLALTDFLLALVVVPLGTYQTVSSFTGKSGKSEVV